MPLEIRCTMAEDAQDLLPVKAHSDDAAFDLKARTALEIAPHKAALVPTGLFLELPVGYEAQVRPRSGLALKHCVTVLNTPGTIDAGYRGEVGVILINHGDAPFPVKRGDRIAQMVIQALPDVVLTPVSALNASSRGTGGFGSTGK
ncbi:MAG: dUTP diphosphatase [Victivallales bacterium]|nr:dUTP diphosphatase [Victivallales bacterium]